MNLRKEPLVFVGSVLFIGFLAWTSMREKSSRSSRRSNKSVEFVHYPTPDVSRALPRSRDLSSLDRDLFTPPSDTRPLELLTLAEPPLDPLPALKPPPVPAPAAALFGVHQRASAHPTPIDGLFVASADEVDEVGFDDLDVTASADPDAIDDIAAALRGIQSDGVEPLTPEQRTAQIESRKSLYDWLHLKVGGFKFGQIRNHDRFALTLDPDRASEEILFVEFDPTKGTERFSGQPVPLGRDLIEEFDFANTVSNKILKRDREFGDTLTPGQFGAAIEFGEFCLRNRNEAPEALQVAVRIFKLAADISQKDPAPRLGLVRCLEASFQFERAFEEYEKLLADFSHRAEVHARLGMLEARFRLFDSAEARLREAVKLERANWEAQWGLGRFLYARERYAEAAEALALAHQFEPGPEDRAARVAIRWDLGAAQVALGNIDGMNGAQSMFDKVLQADPEHRRGRAGGLAVDFLLGRDSGAAAGVAVDQVGFEYLVNQALVDLDAGRVVAARDGLLAAVDADPLRAHAAWRAISWLAETTGYPVEALNWIERAHEADPSDPYTLYQLARLRRQLDDLEGAEEAFRRALDRELDFSDALIGMAELFYMRGDYVGAMRYFERALSIDADRADVHARAGLNFLRLGDVRRARTSFEESMRLDIEEPLAKAGRAWCEYLDGQPDRAIQELRALDDQRRGMDEEEAWRVFARGQMERIAEHERKELWSDPFERRSLRNGWDTDEAVGPQFHMVDGTLVLQGSFNQSQARTRVYRSYSAPTFVSVEMDVRVDSTTNLTRVGMFVSKERPRRNEAAQVTAQISLERHPEGGLQVVAMERAQAEPERIEIPPAGGVQWWPLDQTVRLRIERLGEGTDSLGRVSIDGIPVLDGFSMRSLAATGEVRVGLFAEGDTGRPLKITIDNVEVVYQRLN